MDKVRVIASTTYREAARQPIYYILLLSFAALILLSNMTTLFAFEQEGRMIREMAVSSVILCGALLSIVMAGTVVTAEMERRTALTILSKPVTREQLLLGKYFGLLRAHVVAFLFLLCVLILTIWWYDGFEGLKEAVHESPADPDVVWRYMADYLSSQVLPAAGCVLLGLLEVAILCAACVVVAFHFPMVVTGSVCLGLYLLGHISRYLHDSIASIGPLARWAARVLYLFLPTLDAYNLSDFVAGGGSLSPRYLGLSSLYAAAYVSLVLFVGARLLARKEIQ